MKRIARRIAASAAVATAFAVWAEPVARAVFDAERQTLTFVYDEGDHGTENVDWFSVKAGETLAYPRGWGYNVPWYDCRENVTNVVFDSSFGAYRPKQCAKWFYAFRRLESIAGLGNLDVSEVAVFTSMFEDCAALTALDLSTFDTSKATDMYHMFYDCKCLTSLDVSSFDTSHVGDMEEMFSRCEKLPVLDLSRFDTASVTNMNGMFHYCSELATLDVSGFDTSKVTDMGWMFFRCAKVEELDVSGFDTSSVTNMENVFYYCSTVTNLDVSGFVTSKAQNMSCMFLGCSALSALDVSRFDTSHVTDLSGMFGDCSSLARLDVSGFDTSKATDLSMMFGECWALEELDVRGFVTSNATDIASMFRSCQAIRELDLSGFDTSKVTDMTYLFENCKNLEAIYVSSSFVTEAVEKSYYVFAYCSSLVGERGTAYDYGHTGIEYARLDGVDGLPGYFSARYRATVGQPAKFDLVDDLGVEIDADPAAGDKVSVKIETLPKGLKLVTTPVYADPNAKKKVVVDYRHTIEGVPTEMLDARRAPMYARVTVTRGKTGTVTLQRVPLDVFPECRRRFRLGDDVTGRRAIALPEDVTAVAGPPPGLSFAAKDVTKTNKDKSVTTNAVAHTVFGTPTKAGLFAVKITTSTPGEKGKVVKTVATEYWRVDDPANTGAGLEAVETDLVQGVVGSFALNPPAGAKIAASGLPDGLKLVQDKATGTYTLAGTPTKPGAFTVVLKTTLGGTTVTERFAIEVAANPYAGAYRGLLPYGEDSAASLTLEVEAQAAGTVKATLVEDALKTSATVKNLDAGGTTATFLLKGDAKRKRPDRALVLDFANFEFRIDDERIGLLSPLLPAGTALPLDEVQTLVLDEVDGGVTNAFGYFTSTYDAKKTTVSVAGKLWDGTALKAANLPIVDGGDALVAPFLVTDKSKDVHYVTFKPDGAWVQVRRFGERLSLGRKGHEPTATGGFAKADLKALKNLAAATADAEVVFDFGEAGRLSLAVGDAKSAVGKAAVNASSGLATVKHSVKTPKGGDPLPFDGYSFTAEILPYVGGDGNVHFRGFAVGTKKGAETLVGPVWTVGD